MHDILNKLLYKSIHLLPSEQESGGGLYSTNPTLSDWVWGKQTFYCSPTQSMQKYSTVSHWNYTYVANDYFRVPIIILWNLNLWQAPALICTHVKPFSERELRKIVLLTFFKEKFCCDYRGEVTVVIKALKWSTVLLGFSKEEGYTLS